MELNWTYILDDNGNPVHEPDLLKWCQWMAENEAATRVGHDVVGDAEVSTVFLGMNLHPFGTQPVCFETMVFKDGTPITLYTDRHFTRAEAEAGHRNKVRLIRHLQAAHVNESTSPAQSEGQ